MDFIDGLERLLLGSRIYGIRLVSLAPEGEAMLQRLANRLAESSVIDETEKARFVRSVGALTVDCSMAPFEQWADGVSEATRMVRNAP